MYFDENGRFNTSLINSPVIKKSRNYFALETNLKNNINLEVIYKNFENNFDLTKNISLKIFKEKIQELYNQISLDENIKNLLKGFSFPYLLPIMRNNNNHNTQPVVQVKQPQPVAESTPDPPKSFDTWVIQFPLVSIFATKAS